MTCKCPRVNGVKTCGWKALGSMIEPDSDVIQTIACEGGTAAVTSAPETEAPMTTAATGSTGTGGESSGGSAGDLAGPAARAWPDQRPDRRDRALCFAQAGDLARDAAREPPFCQ